MTDSFQGKTIVVTGGSSGIGRGICRSFAMRGGDVIVADNQKEPREGGPPTDKLLADEYGVNTRFAECDVTQRNELEAAIKIAEELGGIDIMVNNAGIFETQEFLKVTPDEFDQMISTNTKGVFFGAQVAADRMIDAGSGVIINISSTAALSGSSDRIPYGASKAAVKQMTYSLADRLGPEGIRVNAVLPGLIDTKMADWVYERDMLDGIRNNIPSRRLGTPEDIAEGVVFLASEQADYVNGETLIIDGGASHT